MACVAACGRHAACTARAFSRFCSSVSESPWCDATGILVVAPSETPRSRPRSMRISSRVSSRRQSTAFPSASERRRTPRHARMRRSVLVSPWSGTGSRPNKARARPREEPSKEAGPLIWLRGQELNLRPSRYEGDFTQPADGRRPSCFQSPRVVIRARSPLKSTQRSGSPLLFGQDLVKVSTSLLEPLTFALARRSPLLSWPVGFHVDPRHDGGA